MTASNSFLDVLALAPSADEGIYERVSASAGFRNGAYWLELLFAIGIATLGLLVNSPVVIIGAMLISPIMGPILATGLGLATGDLRLTIRAAGKLLLSAALAITVAALLVVLLPFREMTAEIAARTQPNTIDLVIALFSGAVGSIALFKSLRGAITSIPGVAIAVALLPPLCVVGYGVAVMGTIDALQGAAIARGAGLLFATNVAGIALTAMIVFLFARIESGGARRGLVARLMLIVVFVSALLFPLSRSYAVMKDELRQQRVAAETHREIAQLWDGGFARNADGTIRSYVDKMSVDENVIHLRVFTNRRYSAAEKQAFTARATSVLHQPVTVQLVEIPTSHLAAQRAR